MKANIYYSVLLRKGNVLVKIMFDESNYEQKQDNTSKWVTDIGSVFSTTVLTKRNIFRTTKQILVIKQFFPRGNE